MAISSTTAGDCHDAGSTRSASSQTIGRVLTTNGSGGTYAVALGLDASAAGSGAAIGSGILNYVARWISSTALGTGTLYDNGTQVGIGTASVPTGVTEAVNGTVKVAGTGSEACTAAQVGSIRYNPTGNYFELCSYP